MIRIAVLTCLTLLLSTGCSTPARRTGDPTVIPPRQISQLLRDDRERLAGIDSPSHVSHTYLGVDITGDNALQATRDVIVGVSTRLYRFTNGDSPLKAAAQMEDASSPDRRREGMMELARNRFARKDPYTKRYAQIGANDAEYHVRAAAIRALNYSRSRSASALFVSGLDAPDAPVRLESAKALANVPAEAAIPKLIAHLQKDDDKDVRIACADALRNFKTLDVARSLSATMSDRDFAVAWQARRSLVLMTGRDFRYDEGAWLEFLSKGDQSFLRG